MRFLGLPAVGAWLLLAAVAALVVLLYLLKPSPRRLIVASSLIWQRVLRQRKRKPERLRWWLSLLLALSVALSLALALTRPEIAILSGNAAQVVLVLDTSPSMSARGFDGRTRFERALERAREIVRAGGSGSRYLVADTTRGISTPVFQDGDGALATLGAIKPGATDQPWFPDVAMSWGAGDGVEAMFITDGVAGIEPPPPVRTVSVFQSADNVGITAFEVRRVAGDARGYEAFIEVFNASPGNKRVQLRVAGVGHEAITRTLQLPGSATAGEVLDVSAFDGGPVQATVSTQGDGLALDDKAFAFLPGKRALRLALLTPGNPVLERSLRALPGVVLTIISAERLSRGRRFDAAVFDRIVPREQPSVPALMIRPGPAAWLPPHAGEITETMVAQWDATHPVLRNVGLRDILIDRAMLLRSAAAHRNAVGLTRVLASGPAGQPLLLASHTAVPWVELAFALDQSNFPRQPGFPVFLDNALDWLTAEPPALAHRLGLVRVPGENIHMFDAAGREVPVQQVPGGAMFEVSEPAFYTGTVAYERLRVVANLFDPRVSAINTSPLAGQLPSPPSRAHAALVSTDPWIVLLFIAVVLLAVEWVTFNRRVTV